MSTKERATTAMSAPHVQPTGAVTGYRPERTLRLSVEPLLVVLHRSQQPEPELVPPERGR